MSWNGRSRNRFQRVQSSIYFFKNNLYSPCVKNVPTGECPTGILDVPGPGDELGSKEAGLGTCSEGFEGEPASRLEPGDGCGSIDGDGLIFEGNDGGDAILNDVAGLEEYA